MPCHFRHLKEVLGEAGAEVTPVNIKEVDRAIHEMAGVSYKDCPATWKWVKQQLADSVERQQFISRLKSELKE